MIAEPSISSKRKASKIVNKPLTSEEFEMLVRVSNDPFYFVTFVLIPAFYSHIYFVFYVVKC